MSIFVGSLAFDPASSPYAGQDRMGILVGSFLAAIIGYLIMKVASPRD